MRRRAVAAESLAAAAGLALRVDGLRLPVQVRRSRQARRARLRLLPDGTALSLVLPAAMPLRSGVQFVEDNTAWVRQRLAQLPQRVPFASGAVLPVGGLERVVRHCPERRGGIWLEADVLAVGGAAEDLAGRVEAWLRAEAKRALAERAAPMARRLGCSHGRITVRDTRTRWGSCSATGDLSFSWRLILAPPDVLSYVVAHELAHLLRRDHSPAFWAVVSSLVPNVADSRGWLRRQGATLFRFG